MLTQLGPAAAPPRDSREVQQQRGPVEHRQLEQLEPVQHQEEALGVAAHREAEATQRREDLLVVGEELEQLKSLHAADSAHSSALHSPAATAVDRSAGELHRHSNLVTYLR